MTEETRAGNTHERAGEGLGSNEALSLERLMERYQQGDAAAFHSLFRAVSGRLHRYLSMASGAQLGDDLLQQTWLEVHRARATYDSRRPVLPWLFAITRNVRRHALRSGERLRQREGHSAAGAATHTPGAALEEILSVRRALAALPERQQEVLILLKYAELSIDETAAVLGISPGAVKQKAHRAYEKLRDALGPDPAARMELAAAAPHAVKEV